MQQLTGADATFLYSETPRAPAHLIGVFIYDPSTAGGAVSFDDILRHYERHLHLSTVFRRTLAWVPLAADHPYWIDDPDFDLEFHVRHIALPKPGDWQQLCTQAARLHSRPLDLARPLWEVTVIEGLDGIPDLPPGCFAVVQKTHHAATDGIASVELTTAIHDLSPEGAPTPPTAPWEPEDAPTDMSLLLRAAAKTMTNPRQAMKLLRRTIPGARSLAGSVLRRDVDLPQLRAPRTRFNGTVSSHRVIQARRFELDAIRRIKSSVPGATINDAVVTLVGGALRTYLADKGELPKESLRAMLPISVRTAADAGVAGNKISAMVATLGTDIADPKRRLGAVVESTHQSKAFSEAVGALDLAAFSDVVPGALMTMAAAATARFGLAARAATIVNTGVSNVPGPRHPLYLAGARLVTFFGTAQIVDGMGLLHGVTSYCGEVTVCATSSREMMPDPGFYAECLASSYDELVEACL